MRRAAAAFLILLLAAGTGRSCEAEDEKKVQAFRCEEDRSACVLLQMAVAGEFDHFDPGDALYLRVYSAVFLQLRDITEEDVSHFTGEFDEEADDVRSAWYEALSACLLAHILYRLDDGASLTDAERVLLLFLQPDFYEDSEEQIREIRAEIRPETLSRMADDEGVPGDYVKWLIQGERDDD